MAEAIPTTAPATTPASIASSPIQSTSDSTQFLKPSPKTPRKRPASPNLSDIASAGLRKSPGPSLTKIPKTGSFTAPSMTAAAAMADERRRQDEQRKLESQKTSPNPRHQALTALMEVREAPMSNPDEAPNPAKTLSEPMTDVAKSLHIPEDAHGDNTSQTSPVSLSSFDTTGTLDSATGVTVTANVTVASPGQITDLDHNVQTSGAEPSHDNKAFSYPGPLLSAQMGNDPRRGMSLPHSVTRQTSPRSPSTKKHKCPYCSTEFTRHHNLKSHLLTHSQEKPYVCQQCDQRFRRLHDLKRHTKLHTGERPHVCGKCGRSFARGDALARHNKGAGGCAGRRSSMGGFGTEEKYAEPEHDQHDEMEGLVYTTDPKEMDDNDRRKSLPTIKRHPADPQIQAPPGHMHYQRSPSTYPPVRQATGSLYPPPTGMSSASTSPGSQSSTIPFPPAPSGPTQYHQPGAPPVFAQGGMTESPKPLSPAAGHAPPPQPHDNNINRNRSPSFTQQFHQQQMGRRASNRTPPPPVGLPSMSTAPQLPSLPSLTSSDPRYTLHSQQSLPSSHPPQPSSIITNSYPPSTNNSTSSHGTVARPPPQSHGSGDTASTISSISNPQSTQQNANPNINPNLQPNMFSVQPGNEGLWSYIRGLEEKILTLQNEVGRLGGMVTQQQAQIAALSSQGPR
ncbi:MAG: hypothetical protein M1834_005522 [Cirrosporium novae-zelandiae]|nr:MAG: hypothetical protein M1834_005522 [Cirrosporium novae-zelandiae]